MGLDLTKAEIFDTMYGLGLLRIEAKGLKPASYRWCRTKQDNYMGLVEGVAKERQIEYLINASAIDLGKPETRLKYDKGVAKLYNPKKINLIAQNILSDIWSGKVNKDGKLTDPVERWFDTDEIQRKKVEQELGRFPTASLNDLERNKAIFYAGRDADITGRLKHPVKKKLIEMDLIDLFNSDMEILPFLWSMQQNGMPASRSRFEELYSYFDDQSERIISTISNRYFCGRPFNPRSNPQIGVLLRSRGLRSIKKTKTGKQSAGKKAIEHLRYEDDAIELLFQAKEKLHLRDSFCKKTLELIPEGEEIHDVVSNFLITKVETRRLATEDPNLLAVPSRTAEGKKIRKCYIASEGGVFLSCDYSQAESRFMASESGDYNLCKLYIDGRDIHTETAARLLAGMDVKKFERLLLDGDDHAKKLRRDAKDINFGILYMIQAYGLETQFRMRGVTEYDVKHFDEMIKGWYRLYKGVKDYQNRVISRTRRLGYVRDHWGMYRYLPNIWSSDDKLRAEAERQSVSHRIQGGAHGMLRRAMGYLAPIIYSMNEDKVGLNVKPRLPIHDELLFTCEEGIAEDLMTIVIDGLVNHSGIKLKVPIEADGKIATNWGECK
jgi:DNA polymerase-1